METAPAGAAGGVLGVHAVEVGGPAMGAVGTCASREHCDTDEAHNSDAGRFAGMCTKKANAMQGEFVPVWLSGCPDYTPVTSPQGDGDAGEGGP